MACELDPGNPGLLTPSPVLGMSTILTVGAVFKSDVLLRLLGLYMRLNPVEASVESFKILAGSYRDLPSSGHP